MSSRPLSLLFSVLVLIFVTPAAFAHDVTITGTHTFQSLDGSANDHDSAADGVFTVSDGSLVVNGAVHCNDEGPGGNDACSMTFAVSGNMTVTAGGALYAENRNGAGSGGTITLNVGGDLALEPNAIISAASISKSSGANGGAINAVVGGGVTVGTGSTIDAGTPGGVSGSIAIAAGGVVTIDGNILSGPSRTFAATRLAGVVLTGATGNQHGGPITISSTTFAEPAVLVGASANVVSQGENGVGAVTLDGCGIAVNGLVASVSRSSSANVTIRSGKSVVIDGRDLGGAGLRMGRIRADSMTGTATGNRIDIYASDSVAIHGSASALAAVTAHTGANDPKGDGGSVRVVALAGGASASGNAIAAGGSGTGNGGGSISIESAGDAFLDTASLHASGDFGSRNANRNGGTIAIRSYAGDVIWTNGTGDVRPVGSASNLPPADQGSIVLSACGTVDTTGSTFPVNGTATSIHPQTHTGVCSPAAPALPVGVPALITCNTPPVADDATASTNEDGAVTVTLTGSDADGDALTFSIVTPPANGSVGNVTSTGPTSAEVVYSPAADYNGTDSFVFRANDGNGGTDDATATISIAAVNDPPSFLAGPSVNVLEDAGAQTYANWATSISAGPSDESSQTVTFSVTNDNPSLFSIQPALDASGTLTFAAAPNAAGSATITVVAQDDGGTANGGDDTSAAQTSTISITAVNDAPSFVAGPNQTIAEDAAPQTVPNWATSISAGPNETQNLTFHVSADDPSLFAAGPAVAPDGTLTYTPAADANGSATISIHLQDDGGTANGGADSSSPQTFTITLTAVNDAPSFTSGGDVSVLEDSGSYSAAWASAMTAGPADESGQALTFSVSNDNTSLFATQPTIAADGTLSFVPASNAFGSATVTVTLSDDGGTANAGADTSAGQSFTITIDAVNDAPSFTPGADQTVAEDAGAQTVANWATAISAGPGETQNLTFVVTNDASSLFSSQPAIAADGTLTYTASPDANGVATVTVQLQDDGGTTEGGDDTSDAVTFTITMTAVNDAPSFTGGPNQSILEDSGAQTVAGWATAVSAGPADESGQALTFVISTDNAALFSSQPSVDASGTLTYAIASNAFGSATVTVKLQDNGGTANGGVDTSAAYTFTIVVESVNDAPSFTAGGNVTVNEDSGAYSATWASAISAGPNETQNIAFAVSNDNNALFTSQPAISPAGVLTFTSAPNAFGSAVVTVTLSDDGGTANGGTDTSAAVTFTITVSAVNDGPTAAADSWETFGNTEIRVDLTTTSTPHVIAVTASGRGVLHNDSDPEGDPISITSVVGCSDTTAPFDCTFGNGSKLSLAASGAFSWTPGPGVTTGSFQYVVTDNPAAGTPASSTGTVTFVLHEVIWYVNGSVAAAGNGTSKAPFQNFGMLTGSADVDAAGHYIFVHSSVVAGAIEMESNQRLLGEGVGLTLPYNLNGNPGPVTLVAAGAKPVISAGASDAVSVIGVTGVEVAGLALNSAGGRGIVVQNGTGLGASVRERSNSESGVQRIDVSSSGFSASVRVNGTSITSSGNGLDARSSAGALTIAFTNGTITSTGGNGMYIDGAAGGTVTITALSNVSVSGDTALSGVVINQATFDSTPGGAFDTVAADLSVGVAGNAVGGAGVVMTDVSGDVAFGSLTAFPGTGAGVSIAGSGLYTGSAGMRITNGGGTINAPAGIGLSVTNATIGAAGVTFTSISSTGGANGIALNNTGTAGGLTVTGTGAAGSGGTISGATGDGVALIGTAKVSLGLMSIHRSRGNGIYADDVTDFALSNSTVTESDFDDAGTSESGIRFGNLSGNASIANSTVSGTNGDAIRMTPTTAVLSDLSITNSTIGPNMAMAAGSGIALVGSGTSVTKITVTGSTFTANRGSGVLSTITDTASADVTVTGSTLRSNNIGVDFATSLSGDQTFVVTNNVFLDHRSNAVNVVSGTDATSASRFVGTISNNQIGNGTAGSGSAAAFGIAIDVRGDVDSIFAVQSNTIQNTDFEGIFVQSRLDNDGDGETGRLDLTLTGNSVGTPDDDSAFPSGFVHGVRIESRHTTRMFLNIGGNSAGSVGGAEHFRVRQRDTSSFNLERFTGVGTSAASVAAFVAGENGGGSTASATVGTTFTGVPTGTTRTP